MNYEEAEAEFSSGLSFPATISRTFDRCADRYADRIAQRYKGGVHDRSLVAAGVIPDAPDGSYADLSYDRMRSIVESLAAGFREIGVESGSRVAIYARTRMEWAQADFAALAAGGVVTTVYPSASSSRVKHLLDDSTSTVVIAEHAEHVERIREVAADLDHDLQAIVTMDVIPDDSLDRVDAVDQADAADPDELTVPDTSTEPDESVDPDTSADSGDLDPLDVPILSLGDLHERGSEAFDPNAYDAWLAERGTDDLASLIYTSGTTGRPKGVMLTHRILRSNLAQCYTRLGPRRHADSPGKEPGTPHLGSESTSLSYLPLAHVFERLVGHYLMFAAGATVAYAEAPDTLAEDLSLVSPTVATGVPRVYEKLDAAIRDRIADSAIKRRLFEWALAIGLDYRETDRSGAVLSAKHSLADSLVLSSVREAFGGEIDFFISGGGPLSSDLCERYHAMGVPILEGYGLTETSPVVTLNPPDAPEIGTIGPPVIDTEVTLDRSVGDGLDPANDGDIGELLIDGPQVTNGYLDAPAATREAFTDDGRFRTGDVVELRPDGYIEFRERADQLLILSTGKTVAPAPIEDALSARALIESCLVVGDSRKFVSALVVPDVAAIEAWAADTGVDLPEDRSAICRDDRARERIASEIDRVNEKFEPHERIKRFRLVPEPFSRSNGLLTPTMKKKRPAIVDRYAAEFESMYEE
ncbi:long-chain fatty acid--CoA ligase [Halopenitus sp. H-Gu1]|uniref:AMP-dependent synthetase/ligase n=1 Tax=Halopenitus sp. H-Gu1 TaxID=3242697 RepID=UPI00359DADF5